MSTAFAPTLATVISSRVGSSASALIVEMLALENLRIGATSPFAVRAYVVIVLSVLPTTISS
ncbi:hypothetical protein D3C83_296020 [compost metagenome]